MPWKRKLQVYKLRKDPKKTTFYSISKKLKREGKITEEFEIMLSSLTIEDVIALRLELSTKVMNGYLYGLPFWKAMPNICREALVKYAISATRSESDAAMFLGVHRETFRKIVKFFEIEKFFSKDEG